MESAPFKVTFPSRVSKIEERYKEIYVSGIGKDALFRKESQGWFLHLLGSWESLFVGHEKPELDVGDIIYVTLSRKLLP